MEDDYLGYTRKCNNIRTMEGQIDKRFTVDKDTRKHLHEVLDCLLDGKSPDITRIRTQSGENIMFNGKELKVSKTPNGLNVTYSNTKTPSN